MLCKVCSKSINHVHLREQLFNLTTLLNLPFALATVSMSLLITNGVVIVTMELRQLNNDDLVLFACGKVMSLWVLERRNTEGTYKN